MARKKTNRNKKSHPGDECVDWRVFWTATLAEPLAAAYPGGPSHKAGARLYHSARTTGAADEPISYIAPNPVALSFDLAVKAMRRAKRLRTTLAYEARSTPMGVTKSVANPNTPHLFDMFEACMETAVFSFSAIETFCNYFIAAKLDYTITLHRRDGAISIEPDEVARNISTEEKLSLVLPELLGCDSPKGKKVWEQFKVLKRARDATIHLKHDDVSYGGKHSRDDAPLFGAFFQDNVLEFPKYTLDMIGHFGPPKEGSRWFALARKKLQTE